MSRRGRKPMALAHVQHLDGSAHAKQRMTMLLLTLQGSCTIAEACDELELSESRFHALRHCWLQEALQLLEPRTPGRKPRSREEQREVQRLQQQIGQLRRELALARARCEVLETLAVPVGALKKGALCS